MICSPGVGNKGKTWTGPKIAFDIDYSQHGFIPLIPHNSRRIYAFGTQPIPGMYTREHGLQENRPSASATPTTTAIPGRRFESFAL